MQEITILKPYNPLDKTHLGESIAFALRNSSIIPLANIKPFIGAGIYAIYYTGDFSLYNILSRFNQHNNFVLPIYVGKAVPTGARKGLLTTAENQGDVLYRRLNEHLKSVEATKNLDSKDFFCRYIAVDDIWIPLAESLLINEYQPVWNIIIDGFGNHAPGGGRTNQKKSPWDTIHPGRPWADSLPACNLSQQEIFSRVQQHLAEFQKNKQQKLYPFL